jgi:RimJ/RimL family protein N-acetyltransferase
MDMRIETLRFSLRDFSDADRQSFVDYQLDPRYRRLHDRVDGDAEHAARLFDLFMAWRLEAPRQNFQIGIFERATSRLCGCAGLRGAGKPEGTAVVGLELTPRRLGAAWCGHRSGGRSH